MTDEITLARMCVCGHDVTDHGGQQPGWCGAPGCVYQFDSVRDALARGYAANTPAETPG